MASEARRHIKSLLVGYEKFEDAGKESASFNGFQEDDDNDNFKNNGFYEQNNSSSCFYEQNNVHHAF